MKPTPFVPPIDDKIVKFQVTNEEEEASSRPGKRQTFLHGVGSTNNNDEKTMNSATARIPLQDKQSGDNSGENEVTFEHKPQTSFVYLTAIFTVFLASICLFPIIC